MILKLSRPFASFYYYSALLVLLTFAVHTPVLGETTETESRTTASAVSAVPTPTSAGLSDDIAAAIEEVEKQQEADPESEAVGTALELLTQARDQIALRDKFSSETRANEQSVREVPAQIARVKASLEEDDAGTTAPLDLPTTATADFVDQRLGASRAELQSLQSTLAEIQTEQQRRSTRIDQIPKELVEARQKKAEAGIALQSAPGTDDPMLDRARRLFAQARTLAADAQTSALEVEQRRYAAREELLPIARQLISERIASHEAEISMLENRLVDLRRVEATATARQMEQASTETGTSHSLVRQVAAENTSITAVANLGAVVERQDEAQEHLREIRQEIQQTSETFTSLKAKFESVGNADALGVLLRRQRKNIPVIRAYRENLAIISAEISDVNLQLLDMRDKVSDLSNPGAIVREITDEAHLDTTTSAGRAIRSEISRLLGARRDYLSKVADSYDNLFRTLVELRTAEEELIQMATAFKSFIDERILWLPSTDRVSLGSFAGFATAAYQLVSLDFWKGYAQDYVSQGRQHPFVFGFGAVVLLLIIVAHHQWKRRLHAVLDAASKNRLAHFFPLPEAMLYTALYVLPLPVLLILLGLPLRTELQVSATVAALADGFVRGGIALFVIRFVQVIIRQKGVAEVFFVWPEQLLRCLRGMLYSLMWVYVPAIVLVRAWEISDGDVGLEALRVVLVASLLVVFYYTVKLLWPKTTVLRGAQFYQPGKFVYRFRYVIFLGVTVGVAALIVGALLGYLYTATELSMRLNMSAWVGTGLLLVSETAFFWILVKRRRLAIDEARKRRDAMKAQQQAAEAEGGSAEPPAVNLEPALDIASISNQAGRLLRVSVLAIFVLSLWGIWAGVLPALNYLDSYSLWSVSRTVTEVDPATGALQTIDKLKPITIVSVLLAFLVCVGAVVAIRNIPGLLDISIYQRWGVQAGEKYAFNTLIRYVLIIFMMAYVLFLLGLQWKQIQWLAAAVSVGLGFGLQEIFANFVSGLILLFERPIRVGDVVTVGNESGRVSQIRIRATTVVNWDHRILIIPNKELITKSVLNWTLVNSMMRLVLTISVAHGSDYDKAREIVLAAATENPHILKDPGPAAAIEKSTLAGVDLQLLAHLANGDNFMDARHEIITRIERDFRDAGIDLAAQKMDLEISRA